jgi:hypothetical protein
MSPNVEDMFRSLCDERGGLDALSVTQAAIARALATALCTDPISPTAITSLTSLLPPPAGQLVPGHLDLSRLSDDELSTLEGMIERAGTAAPPEPGSDRAVINELLGLNEGLRAQCERANERAAIAEQSEQMHKRMHDEAVEACCDLRARLEAAEAAAWRAGHGEPPGENAAPTAENSQRWRIPRGCIYPR